MTGQLGLFETEAPVEPERGESARDRARRERAEALAQVQRHADEAWRRDAHEALVTYLRTHAEFHVDDFWATSGLRKPRELRALGPVILKAAAGGLMEKTGRERPSTRSHLSGKPVWRSLIWAGRS